MTRPETGTKRKVMGLFAVTRRGAASRAKLAPAFSMLRRCIAFLPFWAEHPIIRQPHLHREMASALPSSKNSEKFQIGPSAVG